LAQIFKNQLFGGSQNMKIVVFFNVVRQKMAFFPTVQGLNGSAFASEKFGPFK